MPTTPASLVAKDLILAARDEHPSFEERRHPSQVLLRALSRKQRSLVSKMLVSNSGALVTNLDTVLPLADFDAGVTLPDYKGAPSLEIEDAAGCKRSIDLVAWELRTSYRMGAFIRNGVLYLTGVAEDWTGLSILRFLYTPEVMALTALTGANGTLVLPNSAEPCLVAYLAYFMAKRSHNDKAVAQADRVEFKVLADEAEEDFLDEMDRSQQAVVSKVMETF